MFNKLSKMKDYVLVNTFPKIQLSVSQIFHGMFIWKTILLGTSFCDTLAIKKVMLSF